jgi:hypothetical protein
MFGAALAAAAAGYAVAIAAATIHALLAAVLVTGVFAATYFAVARAFGVGDAKAILRALERRMSGRHDSAHKG